MIQIDNLMETSGVKFGTSGARGLADAMTDSVCYAYTAAFLQHLESQGEMTSGMEVAVGGDLRPSTDRIMSAAAKAIRDKGYTVVNCGKLPSPALAYFGLAKKIPTVMVTGSHIPDDRNGIKYNKASGEIMKADEAGIRTQQVQLPAEAFGSDGMLRQAFDLGDVASEATDIYIRRYLDFFGSDCLKGKKIGLYQHSSVGRDVMLTVLEGLGADVTPLGRSEVFIPVDTEAIRPEDVQLAKQWAGESDFDAIASADGDCDRPLLSDEAGNWLRGDIAGILCATYIQADAVATPVSCNTAVDKCGRFVTVKRTRIGSPFVIAAMEELSASGNTCVCGYEANGGFLLNSDVVRDDKVLKALPTRDALLPIIGILLLGSEEKKAVSQLAASLPQRFTYSNRLKEFPTDKSKSRIAELNSGDFIADKSAIEAAFGQVAGTVASLDTTDGLRITFDNSEVIHLRPSGNAPEFRCYNEADNEARAVEMNEACMAIMSQWR